MENQTPEPSFTKKVENILDATRRIKDDFEIDLVKKCAQIASDGYLHIKQILKEDLTEREIQIEFDACVQKKGSEKSSLPHYCRIWNKFCNFTCSSLT